jgi:hypothetical protein
MRGLVCRVVAALCLAGTGWVHADLYLNGYRQIAYVGPMFLALAAGSFAVAVLLLVAGAAVPRILAAGLSVGALAGFALSRTVGVFGFVERGLQPAPQAALSLAFELITLALLAFTFVVGGAPVERETGETWRIPPQGPQAGSAR